MRTLDLHVEEVKHLRGDDYEALVAKPEEVPMIVRLIERSTGSYLAYTYQFQFGDSELRGYMYECQTGGLLTVLFN